MRVNHADYLGDRDKSSKRDWHPSGFHENKLIGREPTSGNRHLLLARRTEGHAVLPAAMLSAVLRRAFPQGANLMVIAVLFRQSRSLGRSKIGSGRFAPQ